MKPDYIAAIGGSAGFLHPLIKFFQSVRSDRVTYIVLRHIGVNDKSVLQHLLQSHSILEVKDAADNLVIENNVVYILPAGFYMTIADGRFQLQKRLKLSNCAVDIFMESLAKEYKSKCFGIILSGSGSNGSKGIISIKHAGGKVIVQDPSTCEFPQMPHSAIRTGCIDQIAVPEEMPEIIQKYVHNSHYEQKAANAK